MRTQKRLSFLLAASLGLCSISGAKRADPASTNLHSYVLWVREINGQALYWVNEKPWGRAPLSGLVAAMGSDEQGSLTVILDSYVPIEEISEIQGLMPKLDSIKDVHYYVYRATAPRAGMSEIVWKTEGVPLPASPPSLSAR